MIIFEDDKRPDFPTKAEMLVDASVVRELQERYAKLVAACQERDALLLTQAMDADVMCDLRERNARLGLLLKAQEETKDDIVRQANEAVHTLTERNAKLVAALRIAEIELTAHENDRAFDDSISPELQMIRDILNP